MLYVNPVNSPLFLHCLSLQEIYYYHYSYHYSYHYYHFGMTILIWTRILCLTFAQGSFTLTLSYIDIGHNPCDPICARKMLPKIVTNLWIWTLEQQQHLELQRITTTTVRITFRIEQRLSIHKLYLQCISIDNDHGIDWEDIHLLK